MFWFIGYVLSCYLAADFIAGFWHWLEDRYFGDRWPIVGRWIPKTNDAHHDEPTKFLNQSYLSRNLPAIITAGLAFLATFPEPVCLVFVFVSQANELHALAHRKGKVSAFVNALQETGLFQSPRHHGQHHRSPFLIRYCVMSNWLNPFLDLISFWNRCEWLLAKFGIQPRQNDG